MIFDLTIKGYNGASGPFQTVNMGQDQPPDDATAGRQSQEWIVVRSLQHISHSRLHCRPTAPSCFLVPMINCGL